MCSIVGRLNILSLVAFIKYQLSGLAQAQRYDKNPSNDNRTILVIYKTLWRSRDSCNNKNSSSLLLYSNSNNNNNNSSTFVATISITFACRDLCWQQNLWEIIIWKGTECCACLYMCVKCWNGLEWGKGGLAFITSLVCFSVCASLPLSIYLSVWFWPSFSAWISCQFHGQITQLWLPSDAVHPTSPGRQERVMGWLCSGTNTQAGPFFFVWGEQPHGRGEDGRCALKRAHH